MKNMVKDRFDDIGASIINSGEEIELDLMAKQKSATPNEAESSQALLLPSDTGLDGNCHGFRLTCSGVAALVVARTTNHVFG